MKANKKPSAFRLWLGRVVPIALISALSIAASCNKPDDPTPPTPTPEPQPTEPTKVITIDWNWNTGIWKQLNSDTIKYYAAQPDVKTIILFADKDAMGESHSSAAESSGFPTAAFHRARDTLQTRFDISPKVIGSGTIVVHDLGGAQLPSVTTGTGMALEDSIWYASKGFTIKRNGAAK